jgi:hypothetical protein
MNQNQEIWTIWSTKKDTLAQTPLNTILLYKRQILHVVASQINDAPPLNYLFHLFFDMHMESWIGYMNKQLINEQPYQLIPWNFISKPITMVRIACSCPMFLHVYEKRQ